MLCIRSVPAAAAAVAVLLFAATASASVIQVASGDVTVNDPTHCSLIDAINAANASTTANTTVGACAPTGTPNGGGTVNGVTYTSGNIIVLAAGTYTRTGPYTPPASGYTNAIQFSAADGYWYGADGLPPIASPIVVVGDPAGSVIERSTAAGTPAFRLFYIGGGLSLTNYHPSTGLTTLPGWGTPDANGNLKPGSLTLVNLTLGNGLAQGGSSNDGGGGLGAGGAIYNQGSLTLTGDTLTQNQAVGGTGNAAALGRGGGGMGGNSDGNNDGGGFLPGGLWPDSTAGIGQFGDGGVAGSDETAGGTGGVGGSGGVGGGGGSGGNGGPGGLGIGSNGGPGGNGGFGAPGGFGAGGGGGGFGGTGGAGSTGGAGGNGRAGGNGGFGAGGGSGGPGGLGGLGEPNGSNGDSGSNGKSGFDGGPGGRGAGLGGAVFNEGGTVMVLNSSFTANTAQAGVGVNGGYGGGAGGALFNLNGTVTVRYSTLASNSVGVGGEGGAIYNLFQATPGSPAADAGSAATMTVNSSILSGSLNGATDCENNAGTFTSGHDVVRTPSSCMFNNNDQTGNPDLVALAGNGGPTETMALLPGSPAINMGDTGTTLGPVPTVDQRGFTRHSPPDVGAYDIGPPLSISAIPNQIVTEGAATGALNFTVSGNGPLTVASSSNNTTLAPNANIVISSGCGSSTDNCTVTVTPAAGQTGTAAITLTVTDFLNLGRSSSFAVSVNAAASPPVANNLSLTTFANTAISANASASNPNGDALSFSAGSAAHGTVAITNATTGAFTYTPALDYSGSDSFTFTAKDTVTGLTSNTATVSITVNLTPPPNSVAPVASNLNLTTYANQALAGTLPAAVTPSTDTLSFAAGAAAHGTVAITNATTGAFTYTPASNYSGSDSFTFTAQDTVTGLTSNAATVTITINAVPVQYAPPVASNLDLTAYENTALSGTLPAVASNGHALSYAAATQPTHGTLKLAASSGAFSYMPTSGYTGTDSFTFNASDGTSISNTGSVTIAVNAVPTASAPATPPPSSSGGSGGGGAFGLLGLLLLAGLGMGRGAGTKNRAR